MYEYSMIILGGVILIKTGNTWTRNGETVNPYDAIQDVVMHHDYFDVFAVRDSGVIDCIEYYAGYRYHVTYGVDKY